MEQSKTQWTMAQAYQNHCLKIIRAMDSFSADQNAYQWCSFMRMLYRKVAGNLDTEEQTSVEEGFNQVSDILNVTSNIKTQRNKQFYGNIQREKALSRLDLLEMELLKAMADKGMLPKNHKNTSKQELNVQL